MSKYKSPTINRRQLIKIGATGTLAGILGSTSNATANTPSTDRRVYGGPGQVVKVHMPGMRGNVFPHQKACRQMVDKAVTELTGDSDPKTAWLRFVSPTDKIGIKVNCLGTKMISTMREVTYSIADALKDAGIPDENIVIFDMFASNMMGGRYTQQTNPRKMRVLAHRESTYSKSWVVSGQAKAKFSDIFLWTTAIINVPPIKDHDLAGVTCCMKNVTFGTVEKPHVNHNIINEAIAHLWAREEIMSRVKLNIIDGSTILYNGGPKYNSRAFVPHECIYATTDPVAMDSIAHELIELLRRENGLKSLADVKRSPKYLHLAQKMGIGIADPKLINLKTIDMPKYLEPQV